MGMFSSFKNAVEDAGAAVGGAVEDAGATIGGALGDAKNWADDNVAADVDYEGGKLSGNLWLGVAGVEGSVDVDPRDGNLGFESGVSAGYGDDRVGARITQEVGATTPGQFGLDQGGYIKRGDYAVKSLAATLLISGGLALVGLGLGSATAQAEPAAFAPETIGHYCDWKDRWEQNHGEFGFLCHEEDPPPPPPTECPDGSTVPAGESCPPPPPTECPDGSTVPAGQTCPTPPPVNCPDGSTVPAGQTCPPPPPPCSERGPRDHRPCAPDRPPICTYVPFTGEVCVEPNR